MGLDDSDISSPLPLTRRIFGAVTLGPYERDLLKLSIGSLNFTQDDAAMTLPL